MSTTLSIHEKIDEYHELKKLEKEVAEKIKELNNELKNYMVENNVTELDGEYAKIRYVVAKQSTFDTEPLLHYLKENDLNEAIVVKEVPDETKLQSLIYDGRVSMKDLEPFVKVKETPTLRVTERK